MDTYHFNRIINGLPVDAEYSMANIKDIFIPLLEDVASLQKEKGRRIVIFLAAPPAAGKSTLAEFLQYLSETTPGLTSIQAIGMDGFHRYQDYLLSHTIIRDGVEIPMVKIKGAPPTFDTDKLTEAIKSVCSGAICTWPVYDRLLHNPVEDVITVEKNIILIEGNYLLMDDPSWKSMSSFADYTISIIADLQLLKSRLIPRHLLSGKTPEAAEEFVENSDLANARLCIEKMLPADLRLSLLNDGTFEITSY